jgi:moderate conductance mechanosensitive channel
MNLASTFDVATLGRGLASTLTDACGDPGDQGYVCRQVWDATHNELAARTADVLLSRLPALLLIVVIAAVLNRVLHRAIDRLVQRLQRPGRFEAHVSPDRLGQRAATVGALLRSVTSIVIWTIAVLTALSSWGFNLTPFIAGAGIMGAALAIGAQSLVRDFLSGLFMLMEGQYGVGDVIEAGGHTGRVESVSLRTTSLRDDDGVLWHLPNGQIAGVGNRSQRWSRATVDVTVGTDAPVADVIAVLTAMAETVAADPRWSDIALGRPEVLGVEAIEPSHYTVRMSARTAPLRNEELARELRQRALEALARADLTRPGPDDR